ncbi:MAG: HEPN domain-containing protein [Phycisphaerae bacterium]|nr:hypothetical protein [Phycisphaerales bacterium]
MATAVELRESFRDLPKEDRQNNPDFSIRVWRGLSWLERAENAESDDLEGRFISGWIAFNALYGRLDEKQRPWGDREAMGTFLAQVWRLDHHRHIGKLLQKRQLRILRIIEDKYLCNRFWVSGGSPTKQIKRELRDSLAWIGTPKASNVLHLLFERLYVMRNQVMHGASTKGSKLNRRAMRECGTLLLEMIQSLLEVMIEHGVGEDWGNVCFPPDGPDTKR